MNCPNCGGTVPPGANRCVKCGSYIEQPAAAPVAPQQPAQPAAAPTPMAVPTGPAEKSKIAAGLLGIFLGYLGIHRFYLGYIGIGVAQLVLFLFGITVGLLMCGIPAYAAAIWGLVDGIMILTGAINRDAQGRPLKD